MKTIIAGILFVGLFTKVFAQPDFKSFVPQDPWRNLDGQTNYIKLDGVQFCGKIVDITSDGVRIEGQWGNLGKVYYPAEGWSDGYIGTPHYDDYFVANYPFQAVNGDIISSDEHMMAWYAGIYTYTTVSGSSRSIRKLDYGIPCDPNPDQIAAMQKQLKDAENLRHSIANKQFEQTKIDATNGNSGAQFSVAIHYLHGINCETNRDAGIFWLTKAAEQGDLLASNELVELKAH